jgi:hypothetical protein
VREPGLPRGGPRAPEEHDLVEAPELRELVGEPLRRMVTSPHAPVAVGRDIGDDVRRRARHDLDDELGG